MRDKKIILLKRGGSSRGFTIIETMIMLAVLGLVIIVSFDLVSQYFKTNKLLNSQLTLQTEGRNALSQMVDDLRRANQGSNGAFAIDSVNATSIVFYSNVDNDSYFEKVRYFISGTELRKGVIVPAGNPLVYNPASETVTVLSKNVANGATPLFEYHDNAYTGVEPPLVLPVDITRIRLVKINLILDDNPSSEPGPLSMEAKVSLRNLKDNY